VSSDQTGRAPTDRAPTDVGRFDVGRFDADLTEGSVTEADPTERVPRPVVEPPDGAPVGAFIELTPPSSVARAALERAKAGAKSRGIYPGQAARRRSPLDPPRGSPGRDGRDPQPVADTLARLLRDRGWVQEVSVGGVIGRWRDVMGDQIADHCEPETFDAGILTVRTDSTAWATQVRLLVPQLLRRLADDVGEDVVREINVVGPAGPGFKRGPRSVPGRGPRDTWG
jgi:predicted nucleic acid-binding Zn ribbon protein